MFPHWFPTYKQLLIVVDGALSQGGGACKQDFSGAISPYITLIFYRERIYASHIVYV